MQSRILFEQLFCALIVKAINLVAQYRDSGSR